MKKRLVLILMGCCLLYGTSIAQEVVSQEVVTSQIAELRTVATYNQSFKHNLGLSIEEELRFCIGGTSPASFMRSHTTLSLEYAPLPYLGMELGYMFKLYGDKGWENPNKYIRHRVFFNITGEIKVNRWAFSLRERFLMDCRSDSVNMDENNKIDLALRHRLQASYSIPNQPLRVYAGIELSNTLNAPTEYINQCSATNYKQYINYIRPEVGLHWNVNKRHRLTLAYRFDYGYKRKISILSSKDVALQHQHDYKHLLILSYQFGN